jgi:hypothetical protein
MREGDRCTKEIKEKKKGGKEWKNEIIPRLISTGVSH